MITIILIITTIFLNLQLSLILDCNIISMIILLFLEMSDCLAVIVDMEGLYYL